MITYRLWWAKKVLVRLQIWIFAGHIFPTPVVRWTEKALVRLHTLILTFAGRLYLISFVHDQRQLWWDYTYVQTHLNLHWSLTAHTVLDEQICLWWDCKYAETHLNHHLSTIPHCNCRWAVKTSLRLHICTDSSKPSLFTYTSCILY